MLFRNAKHVTDLVAAKTFNECKLQWIEPQLGSTVIPLHVDMRGLESISHVKEKAEPALA